MIGNRIALGCAAVAALCAVLTACGTADSDGNAKARTTTPPATSTTATNTAGQYQWTALTLEYATVFTKDCVFADYALHLTCHSMLKSDMQSLQQSAASLPVGKLRTDLDQSVTKWLTYLAEVDENYCFARQSAIECVTIPSLLDTRLDIIQLQMQKGAQSEQPK